jgi:hypothetical protein
LIRDETRNQKKYFCCQKVVARERERKNWINRKLSQRKQNISFIDATKIQQKFRKFGKLQNAQFLLQKNFVDGLE